MEVRLGCRDPKRPHDPETNPYQRGDGVFGNWTRSARPMVYDGTCVTTVHFGMLRPLVRTGFGKEFALQIATNRSKGAKSEPGL